MTERAEWAIPKPLAHEEAASLGMWVFLATEVLFFGGLFLCYTVYRHTYPESFASASERLNSGFGTINTAILLTSSLTMALAVEDSKAGRRIRVLTYLALTFALGGAFLGVKAAEYSEDFKKALLPVIPLASQANSKDPDSLFFFLYYAMTGLHALHLTIGLGAVVVLWLRTWKNENLETAAHVTGLYWHFIDLVWIFLYPLLYLVGRLK